MKCSACGGGRAHHRVPGDACWCPNCLCRSEVDRCLNWSPEPDGPKKATATKPPRASLPRSGSLRRQVYDWIDRGGVRGLTDDEVAYKSGHPTEKTLPAREQLAAEGLIEESGYQQVGQDGSIQAAWRAVK